MGGGAPIPLTQKNKNKTLMGDPVPCHYVPKSLTQPLLAQAFVLIFPLFPTCSLHAPNLTSPNMGKSDGYTYPLNTVHIRIWLLGICTYVSRKVL